MKEFQIVLHSVEDVQAFVRLACKQPFAVTAGSDRYSINGKSFIQMFTLDLSEPQHVKMDCTEEEFQQFYQAAETFRI